MTWIVETSLRFRMIVVALAAAVIVLGIQTASKTPLDVFPEFAPPLVEIQTESPGLSTEEVESLITVPLENALNGTPWLKTIRSKSVLGLSAIVLILEDGTDVMRARQMVQERLAIEAPRLPATARPPVILSPLSSTSRAMKIGVSSDALSQMELTDLAKWTIRPRLMAIQGVANVAIWGQRDRQFQVLLDPERLRLNGITLNEVVRASGDAVVVSAGGFIDTPNQRLPVRQPSPVMTTDDLARSILRFRDGVPLRLGDVADVMEGHPAPIGDAVINDGPGLLLIVEKQPWGNTLDVTRKVEDALVALRPALSGVNVDPTIFRPATFIETSIDNLTNAMGLGCLIVAIVLILFLFNWRTALISLIAIPLSLLAASVVLYLRGNTINTMTLAGLVIAVGEVVDDAIIDVENIARRLRLNRQLGNPLSHFRVVLSASLEVRSAVVFASLIVIVVFMPIFFMHGLAGSFFRPLGLSYVLAITASLLVALTVTPALCLLLLPSSVTRIVDAPFVARLKRWYSRILPLTVHKPGLVVTFLLIAFVVTGASLPFLGEEFLPNFQERDFLMHWVEKPGTSLDAMRRITVQVSRELRGIPGVRNFGSHIGRAEVADEVVGPNFTELWISVDPNVDYASTLARIKNVVAGYPGLYRDVLTYLKERIKEVLTGAGATMVIRLYGPNMDILREKAAEVQRTIADVDGVEDLKIEAQIVVPQVSVRARHDALNRFGLSAADVCRAVETMVRGVKVGEIYEDQKIFEVVVWGQELARRDIASLAGLLLDTPGGGHVRLVDLADIEIVPTPNIINRERASRRIDVTCNVRDRDLSAVAREIEQRVAPLEFPHGYHPEFLGEFAARQESRDRLLGFSAFALIGIFLLLHADFQSSRRAALVFVSLPFALIGGVIGALLGGGVLSLGSLVGFVTVLGIAARNGIMLVSHYQHLEREGTPFGVELVTQGALERLAPILMTALCAGLGLLPLVLAGNKPGHEIEFPMAVVILGGLATSTVLNLLLMPSLYLRFGRLPTAPLPGASTGSAGF
ncbi:MAG: efflux RND transporter permease subunit [Phycisphaerales bacterium]|nr:efflux RND transporter permease subunit [Phycisphaerales bacterium]